MSPSLARSRRSFLRAVGTSALALPFYGLLENSAVRAQAGALPMRYVSVFFQHGATSPLFLRKPGETETDFDISYSDCVLRCFDDAATYGVSFKDKLIAIDGMDLGSALASGQSGHPAGRSVFTGATPNSPENSSIDQFLAVEQGLGAETRFSSMAIGMGFDGGEEQITFGAGGVLIQKIIDPSQTYQTYFADLVVGDDPAAQAEAERKRLLGGSLLDYVKTDIDRVYSRVGPTEQAKLDAHLTTLRELEKRLGAFENQCVVPGAPEKYAQVQTWSGGGPFMHEITQLQMGFLAQAMVCDLTRFGSVYLHDLSRGAAESAGISGVDPDNHQAAAHAYRPPVYDGEQLVEAGDAASWERLAVINRYNYGTIAEFMRDLNDAELLDDTLIFMASDMGDPNLHSSKDSPLLLLGGAGGKFNMGRHLVMKPNCLNNTRWCSGQEQFVSQNQVLVSIANAFGVEIDKYGKGDDGSGPMAALTDLGVSL